MAREVRCHLTDRQTHTHKCSAKKTEYFFRLWMIETHNAVSKKDHVIIRYLGPYGTLEE